MAMKGTCDFTIVGFVATVTMLQRVVKVRVITNQSRKIDGQWRDVECPNTLTVFGDRWRRWVEDHLTEGDLILAKGWVQETSYLRGGQTIYETSLIADELQRLKHGTPDKRDHI